jgi:hypothetical protein
VTSDRVEIPEGWAVRLEDDQPTVTRDDTRAWEAVWIEVEGPSDALSPAERLSLTARLARQAAEEWAVARNLEEPRFVAAKYDGWPADGRFARGHAYQAFK